MKNNVNEKKRPYVVPEVLCMEVATETKILTVSAEIKDVPWEDE